MGAWKDMLIDMQEQQAADDWCRYEMERDDAIARRQEIMLQAWQLHRAGMKLKRVFPGVGNINLQIAGQLRAEARQIKRDWG